MAKELGNVAQLVVLVPMDRLVVLLKRLLKQVAPQTVDLGEPLGNETKELCIRLFLRAALYNHRGHLGLLARGQVNLHKLVRCFFGVGARHDGQVNRAAQVHQVGVGLVLDLNSLGFFVVLIIGAVILRIVVVLFIVACLTKNLRLEPLVCFLILLIFRVKLENIQSILDIYFAF